GSATVQRTLRALARRVTREGELPLPPGLLGATSLLEGVPEIDRGGAAARVEPEGRPERLDRAIDVTLACVDDPQVVVRLRELRLELDGPAVVALRRFEVATLLIPRAEIVVGDRVGTRGGRSRVERSRLLRPAEVGEDHPHP